MRFDRHLAPARAVLRLAALLALTGLACRRPAVIARVLEVSGTVQRSDRDAWRDVVPTAELVVGDTLRTGAASATRLSLVGGGVIRVGENARLRLQIGGATGPPTPAIAVELGSAEVEEVTAPVSIVTALGATRVERGAHLRVRSDGQTSSLEVLVGRAVMLEAGQEIPIDAGQGIRIRLGSAEVQRFAVKFGEAIVEAAEPSADNPVVAAAVPGEESSAAPAGPAAAQPSVARRGGDTGDAARGESVRADITLDAGESATLHDGRPQAAVRLRLPNLCPSEAIVELGGQGRRRERLSASRAVVLRLRPGRQSYSVRCSGDDRAAVPRAAGVLSLRRDTGNVPLARRLPANVIEADGRRYTVLFQTHVPQLTLAWPSAPQETGRLELHLDGGSGERVIEGASPRRPLPAGTVQEGTYTFWYQTSSGKQSPKTTLSVRFDNVAPTAQFFRTTASGGTAAPGAISIDGVTVEGAKVSVGGQPLAVDGHGRFRIEATPLDGDDAVAVRLEHPRTGVHYYVRHKADVR